ncbi:TPA: leucine-rich repeat domain-containing protein, partial [Streptococcus suis]
TKPSSSTTPPSSSQPVTNPDDINIPNAESDFEWEDAATSAVKDYLNTIDGVVINKYVGTRKNVHIPDTLGGKKVLAIHQKGGHADSIDGAFGTTVQLEQVRFPNTLQYIGSNEFIYNRLTAISIPNSVTYIGFGAFSYNQLKSVSIPNSVTYIGWNAFSNNRLTHISIPNSLTKIEIGTFANNQLTSVTIPNSVTSIVEDAFTNNHLTSVELPKHLTQARNILNTENIDIATAFDSGVTITYRP